jgi:hypothetical protein
LIQKRDNTYNLTHTEIFKCLKFFWFSFSFIYIHVYNVVPLFTFHLKVSSHCTICGTATDVVFLKRSSSILALIFACSFASTMSHYTTSFLGMMLSSQGAFSVKGSCDNIWYIFRSNPAAFGTNRVAHGPLSQATDQPKELQLQLLQRHSIPHIFTC